jgi:hypothetical protein
LPHLLVFNPLQSKFARHAGDFTIQQLIKFIDSLLERKSKRKYKLVEDYIEIRVPDPALFRNKTVHWYGPTSGSPTWRIRNAGSTSSHKPNETGISRTLRSSA